MSGKLPPLPKIDADQLRKHMEEVDRREEDRRCLTGKFAPDVGRCVACGDAVPGIIAWPAWDGLIGGTDKPRAFVSHWQCHGCGLMYGKCPPPDAGKDKTP